MRDLQSTNICLNQKVGAKKPFARLIASGFGSGYSRVAPGTFGSLAALGVWLLLAIAGVVAMPWLSAVVLLMLVVVGYWAVCQVVEGCGNDDPQWIVVDEWIGMWIPLLLCSTATPGRVCLAFVAFRIFDASKIGPVGIMEKLPGARGIIADDVMAGVLAGGVVLLGSWSGIV